MRGQLWKRVAIYDRELGRQGKGIPLSTSPIPRQLRPTNYLTLVERQSIRKWLSWLAPVSLLLGMATASYLTQAQFGTPLPTPILPTFPNNEQSVPFPCVERAAFKLDAPPPSNTGSETETTSPAETTTTTTTTTKVTTAETSSSTPDKSTQTIPQTTTQRPRPRSIEQRLSNASPLSSAPPRIVTTDQSMPKVTTRVRPSQSAQPQPQPQPKPQPQIVKEGLSSNSTTTKPQPATPPSTPMQAQVIPKQSTMSSSPSRARQAPSSTNGRSTLEETSPSTKLCP